MIRFFLLFLLPLFLADCGNTPAFAHPINMDAIQQIESSNNPAAQNGNHRGLYQISEIVLFQFKNDPKSKVIMDDDSFLNVTALQSIDLFIPEINKHIANYYFDWLTAQLKSKKEILIAWNFGIGNLRKWQAGKVKLPKETQEYLKKYEKITGEAL